jgi:hypothetical protein
MRRRLESANYSDVYDAVLAYMRRRGFDDVDGLADRIAEILAESLSADLDTASTLKKLMHVRSRSFLLSGLSKSEFIADVERNVRAQVNRLPPPPGGPGLRDAVLRVLDVDDAPIDSTQSFFGRKHDTLLRHFAGWLSERLHDLGLTVSWTVSQGMSDQGVDALMEVTNTVTGRVGIQLENDATIRRDDFRAQMARVYGLYDINDVDLLIVLFCGDETDSSVRTKLRHQAAIAAQKKDRNIIIVEPTKAISILGPYLQG